MENLGYKLPIFQPSLFTSLSLSFIPFFSIDVKRKFSPKLGLDVHTAYSHIVILFATVILIMSVSLDRSPFFFSFQLPKIFMNSAMFCLFRLSTTLREL